MRKNLNTSFALFFLGIILITSAYAFTLGIDKGIVDNQLVLGKNQKKTIQEPDRKEGVRAVRIIDGDTLTISTGETVRLIGINTPEKSKCYFTNATNRLNELVLNKKLRIENDVEGKDKYGRSLLYIWVDSVFVNEAMVKEGFAVPARYPPNVKHALIFDKAKEYAKSHGLGVWQKDACQEVEATSTQSISNGVCKIKGNISNDGDKIYHLPGQRNYEKTQIEEQIGEKMFCNEKEAVDAGWRKSKVYLFTRQTLLS